jgi:phosphoesterase RecJ-like protein
MIYTNAADAAPAIRPILDKANHILLLSHVNPDGDAVGTMMGLWYTLKALGKNATPLASSALPSYVLSLPGAQEVQYYQPGAALPDADLIWMVDTATMERVGQRFYKEHGPALASRPLIIVDHHITNEGGGVISLIKPEASSCAEVLLQLLQAMEAPITPLAATWLLLGVITDTQSFQTSSVTPDSLRASATLMDLGANHRAVVDAAYYSVPTPTLDLISLALAQVKREQGLVWVAVTQAMMHQTKAEDEATDELMRLLQRNAGARVCAIFKERYDGSVKVSLRSMSSVDVSAIAQRWGGGGHIKAAGTNVAMPLDATLQEVLPVLRAAVAAL